MTSVDSRVRHTISGVRLALASIHPSVAVVNVLKLQAAAHVQLLSAAELMHI